MITFKVVKERYGWAILMGECMKTLFWSKGLAIREANCLADAIRCHGECAEVIVEDAKRTENSNHQGIEISRPSALVRDMSDLQA